MAKVIGLAWLVALLWALAMFAGYAPVRGAEASVLAPATSPLPPAKPRRG